MAASRAEALAEEVLELHKQLVAKVQTMNEEMHRLIGQVSEIRQLDLAVMTQIVEVRERLAKLTVRVMLIAAGVSLGGGVIAAVFTAWSYMASRLNSFFGAH